jgi:peptidoglycan-associated lipoprotein
MEIHGVQGGITMVKRLMVPFFAVITAAGLALQGCAPASVNPADESSPGMTRTSMVKPNENGGVQSGVRSGSSIEAMRQGKFAVTPESSPLKDVLYDFDQYLLRADAREALKRSAEWLKANPAVRVEIEGHADERGTNEYNLALGAKRAQTSKDYLISLGVTEDRLNAVSYGEEVPACLDHSDSCWQKNRRARFVIIPKRPAL